MPLDLVPQSSASDSRWKIAFVPIGSNPLSVAILNGVTAFNLTYSFVPSGFNYATATADVPDPRLTLNQTLTRLGRTTDTLALQYVDSLTPGSAAVVLTDMREGFFVFRRGVANETAWSVADVVYVLTVQVGVSSPSAPTENGVDTLTQPVAFTGVTKRKVPLVA